ncbi:MAG: helix-turn-helix domain-containing protein [Candidatus Krumholzibacteriia bacterium]
MEIRRLRLEAGITLRGLAGEVEVSAAHLSDVEHDRRRPSEQLLRRIAQRLQSVGATFAALEGLVTGLDPLTREWAASTPGARALLRTVVASGQNPRDILRALEMAKRHQGGARRRDAGQAGKGHGRKGR